MRVSTAILSLALTAPIAARHHRSYSPSVPTTSSSATPVSTVDEGGSSASPTLSSSAAPIEPATTGNTTASSSGGVSVPASCFKPNGFPVGWLPDGVNINDIQNKVKSGTTPCTYGDYAHIVSTSDYGDVVMGNSASTASKSGAVFTISLQPFIPFDQVDASKVAASMNNILSKGLSVVWLRFAHEMNWYISTNSKNTGDIKYYGSTDDFKTLWKNIANAVDRSKVKMFWSPNGAVPPDTITSIGTDWWPGAEYVDIVGMDNYPQQEQTFADAFGEFYDTYSKPNNLPFALGETGWLNGGTDDQNKYWLGQVSSADALARCPNYLGFSWFEYDKPSEGDFRVVEGSNNIAAGVLA